MFNSCTDTTFYSDDKFNSCSGIELPGITGNRGEEMEQLFPATMPWQFFFSLASWKTCSLRLRSSPSTFAMKSQCVESSWAGLKRSPGTREGECAHLLNPFHSDVWQGGRSHKQHFYSIAQSVDFSLPSYDWFNCFIPISKPWTFVFLSGRFHFAKNMRRIVTELYVRDNCHPFKATLLLWVQIPMWVCVSLALRNCSVGALGPAGAASSLAASFYSPTASTDTLLVKEHNVLSLMYKLIQKQSAAKFSNLI